MAIMLTFLERGSEIYPVLNITEAVITLGLNSQQTQTVVTKSPLCNISLMPNWDQNSSQSQETLLLCVGGVCCLCVIGHKMTVTTVHCLMVRDIFTTMKTNQSLESLE